MLSVRATLRGELTASGRTAEDAFRGIDLDRSGNIDESEFATFVQAAVDHASESRGEYTLVVTPELITSMFRALDSNDDGGIAMGEFTTWLNAVVPDDGCTRLAKHPRPTLDHATTEETRTVGSLHLCRLIALDDEGNESLGASKRLAWMLLGDIHSSARMALSLDVQIKVGSGCVLRTRQLTHSILAVQGSMWSTEMNFNTT